MSDRIAFRCDGVPATGLGHLSRCIALAEGLIDGGVEVRFHGEYGETARVMLEAAGISHHPVSGWDGPALARALSDGSSSAVVDSYVAGVEAIEAIGRALPLLVIDDFGRLERYPCAAVLNFTVGAADVPYPLLSLIHI